MRLPLHRGVALFAMMVLSLPAGATTLTCRGELAFADALARAVTVSVELDLEARRRGLPSTKLGRTAKIYYATQTGVGPPEITLFVNEPSRITANYRRFVWTRLTEHFGFRGVPVRLRVRKSE